MGAVGLLSCNNKKAPTRNRDNVGLDVVNPIESGDATELRGMTMPLTGVVLAGGKSRRLGRNKLVEPFQGGPLIVRVIERLRPVCGEIVVVGAEAGGADALPIPDDTRTAFDLYPDKG